MISASSALASRTRSSAKVSFLYTGRVTLPQRWPGTSGPARMGQRDRFCVPGHKNGREERVGRCSGTPTDLLDAGRLKEEYGTQGRNRGPRRRGRRRRAGRRRVRGRGGQHPGQHGAGGRGLELPNLQNLGLGNVAEIEGVPAEELPARLARAHGRALRGQGHARRALGDDGMILEDPLPTYPEGFPEEIIHRFEEETGRGSSVTSRPRERR